MTIEVNGKITKEDIGRKIWDTSDDTWTDGEIVAIDNKGRIICEFEGLGGEVFITKEECISFTDPALDGIIEVNGVKYKRM